MKEKTIELIFSTPPGYIWWTAFLALAFFILYIIIKKYRTRVSKPVLFLFILTRLLILATIFLLLLQPRVFLNYMREIRDTVIIAIDESGSMGLEENGISRLDRVRLELEKTRLIENLRREHNVELFAFSSGTRRLLSPSELLKPEGLTNFSAALTVDRASTKSPVSSFLLFTDGNHTDGEDPVRLSAFLPFPVYSIVPVEKKNLMDIALTGIKHPDRIHAGEEAILEVSIMPHNLGTASVMLELMENGRKITQKSLFIPAGTSEITTRLTVTPSTVGLTGYTVHLPPLENEAVKENNSRSCFIKVTGQKIDILYVENNPRWEFPFLSRTLSRFDTVNLIPFIRFPDGDFRPVGHKFSFPRSRQELATYEVFILGNPDFSRNEPFLKHLDEEVSAGGKGLLLLLGSDFRDGQNPPAFLPFTSNPQTRYITGSVRVELTGDGRASRLLELSPVRQINDLIWKDLPELPGHIYGIKPKAGATILLECALPQEGNNPAALTMRYGRGKVFAFTVDDLYLWKFKTLSIESARHCYENIFDSIITWLSSNEEGSPVQLSTDRYVYEQGDDVYFYVTVSSPNGQLQESPAGRLIIQEEKNNRKNIVFDSPVSATSSAGSIARFHPERVATYHARFILQESLKNSGEVELSGTEDEKISGNTSFVVELPAKEFLKLETNTSELEKIAASTGGRVLTLNETARIPGILPVKKATEKISRSFSFWDTVWMFIFIFGLFTFEWLLRKASGCE